MNEWQGYAVIARGANRICVIDRDNASRCLKFPLAGVRAHARSPMRKVREMLVRLGLMASDNQREWAQYCTLQRTLGDTLHAHVPRYFGLLDSPLGQALITECVRDRSGAPAKPVYAYYDNAAHHARLPALLAAVETIETFLLRHDIPLFDLNSGNLVVDDSGEQLRLVCIDLKSAAHNKELIPVSSWIGAARRHKIRRRIARLKAQLRARMS